MDISASLLFGLWNFLIGGHLTSWPFHVEIKVDALSQGSMDETSQYINSLTDEGRYRLLIEAVTDYAIYLLGPSGIVTSWNPGAQRFKGYRADEIIGQHFSRFYTDEDQKNGVPSRAPDTASREGKLAAQG